MFVACRWEAGLFVPMGNRLTPKRGLTSTDALHIMVPFVMRFEHCNAGRDGGNRSRRASGMVSPFSHGCIP